jgi:hypothetical protein
MDLASLGQGPVTRSCEHGHKPSGSIKGGQSVSQSVRAESVMNSNLFQQLNK